MAKTFIGMKIKPKTVEKKEVTKAKKKEVKKK